MTGIMSNSSRSAFEPLALLAGVIGIITSVIFFLQKFNILTLSFVVSDEIYMYFFAAFTLIAAITLLMTTIGLISVR
jgi:hypothetical protein